MHERHRISYLLEHSRWVSQELAALGERFRRPQGLEESGSGLGISIVQRIAALHGLEVAFGPRADGTGMKVVLTFAESAGA